VRFGEMRLSKDEVKEIEDWLQTLAAANNTIEKEK